jgi:hypothetical protein
MVRPIKRALPQLVVVALSGEYAQIHAAAKLGWLDYQRTRDDSPRDKAGRGRSDFQLFREGSRARTICESL